MALISKEIRSTLWFNLLVMIILALAIYIIFFSSLGYITNHGEEVKMPDLYDKPMEQAVKELKDGGFEIDIDSSFDLKKEPRAVLSQMPDTGAMVKRGRTIFLIVNKIEAPLTPMPDLMGTSYRIAEMMIRSNKLRLGDTTYRPDIANGAILEQLYKGKEIKAGDMVPQGSKIDLVIGDGLGNVEFDVPDVVGLTYPEGIAMLNAMGLQFIANWSGPITDSVSAVIVEQFPAATNELGVKGKIREGDIVDIKVKQTNE